MFFPFHNDDKFPEEAYVLIDDLEKIKLPQKKFKFELEPIIKKYIIENKSSYCVLFIIIFPLIVWNIPSLTSLELTKENRLVIILPVIATIIIHILANVPKQKEKKSLI